MPWKNVSSGWAIPPLPRPSPIVAWERSPLPCGTEEAPPPCGKDGGDLHASLHRVPQCRRLAVFTLLLIIVLSLFLGRVTTGAASTLLGLEAEHCDEHN